MRSVPSPPITTSESIHSRASVSRSDAAPSPWTYGSRRDVPRIVPPRCRMPAHRVAVEPAHAPLHEAVPAVEHPDDLRAVALRRARDDAADDGVQARGSRRRP